MINAKKKLFILGDSISLHYGPYLAEMLEGVYEVSRKEGEKEAYCDLNIPTGGNGGDSGQVLSYLNQLFEEGKLDYDFMLLNCGLHDIKVYPHTNEKQVGIVKYRENLKDIVSLLGRAKVRTVWVRSTPVVDLVHNSRISDFARYACDLDEYNEAADMIMNESGVFSIDLYTFTKNLGEDIYCDHVHFKEEIRALQAAFIAGCLFYTHTNVE